MLNMCYSNLEIIFIIISLLLGNYIGYSMSKSINQNKQIDLIDYIFMICMSLMFSFFAIVILFIIN